MKIACDVCEHVASERGMVRDPTLWLEVSLVGEIDVRTLADDYDDRIRVCGLDCLRAWMDGISGDEEAITNRKNAVESARLAQKYPPMRGR